MYIHHTTLCTKLYTYVPTYVPCFHGILSCAGVRILTPVLPNWNLRSNLSLLLEEKVRKRRRPKLEAVMLWQLEKKLKQEVNHKRQLKELTPFLIPDHQIRNQILKEFITDRGLVPDPDQALENEHQDVVVIDIILHHLHPDTHSIAEEGGICVQGLHPNPQFEVEDSEVEAGVEVVTGGVYTTVIAVEVRRHQLVRV